MEIDQGLRRLRLERDIMLELPHSSVLQDVVSSSELLVTSPSRAAKLYERNSEVNVFELPFAVKSFNVSASWIITMMIWKRELGLFKHYKIFFGIYKIIWN